MVNLYNQSNVATVHVQCQLVHHFCSDSGRRVAGHGGSGVVTRVACEIFTNLVKKFWSSGYSAPPIVGFTAWVVQKVYGLFWSPPRKNISLRRWIAENLGNGSERITSRIRSLILLLLQTSERKERVRLGLSNVTVCDLYWSLELIRKSVKTSLYVT